MTCSSAARWRCISSCASARARCSAASAASRATSFRSALRSALRPKLVGPECDRAEAPRPFARRDPPRPAGLPASVSGRRRVSRAGGNAGRGVRRRSAGEQDHHVHPRRRLTALDDGETPHDGGESDESAIGMNETRSDHGRHRRPDRDRLGRRHAAVRHRRRRHAAWPPRGAAGAARLGRSGAGGGLSASLDRGRADRPHVPPCPAGGLPRHGVHRRPGPPDLGPVALRLRDAALAAAARPHLPRRRRPLLSRHRQHLRGARLQRARRARGRAPHPDAGGAVGPAPAGRRDLADIRAGSNSCGRPVRSTSARRW